MSYCRWSTNDFQCDVYVYNGACGRFMIHVAGNRVVFRDSLPETIQLSPGSIDSFIARQQAVMKMVDDAERVKIGLDHDGETFAEPDAAACAAKLIALRDMGYLVPESAIEILLGETE